MINNITIPRHVAIIMDGNRRWAKAHGLPVLLGHKKVVDDILEPLLEHAAKKGVAYITLWAWSTENWERKKDEVAGIMKLFKETLKKRGNRLHQKGVRVKTIGDITQFDTETQTLLHDLINLTKDNTNITAIFALNYGGRDEILRAINKMTYDNEQETNITNDHVTCHMSHVTENDLSRFLDTAGIPDPDMIVRTGGDQRLSGFLLWQSEYSELYFPSWYMPEFTPKRLDEVIEEFGKRKRRYGK